MNFTGIDEYQINVIFPPITSEKVTEKRRKMRNKAAQGPEGIRKKHLQIPGLSTVLGKTFNIILFCSGFPNEWKTNRTTIIPKAGKDSNKVEN
jgi:hypothetical protein